MRCTACPSKAQWRHKDSRLPYCSVNCALLIEGGVKRGRDEEEEKDKVCLNERDPINQDEFVGMDKRDILVIGRYCFHLPSLYHWIVNLNHAANPLTNIAFTAEDRQSIVDAAMERYPLAIEIKSINGRVDRMQTTALQSVEAFSVMLGDADGVYRLLEKMTTQSFTFSMKIDERILNVIRLLTDHEGQQLVNIGVGGPNVTVMRTNNMVPAHQLINTRLYRTYAAQHGYPLDVFDERIRLMVQTLDENEVHRARAMELRRLREQHRDRDAVPNPPGTERVNVSVISVFDYGVFPVYVRPDGVLMDLEPAIRERLRDVTPLSDRNMRFVFAGRLYNRTTPFAQLPGIMGTRGGPVTVVF